jgi:hypothetical protein
MGYSFNGVCYDDATKAHNAFKADFPKVDNGLVELLNSSSIAGTPPTLTYSVRATDFGDGSVRTISGTLQFNTCDVGTMESFPIQSLMVLAAFTFAAIHGFKTAYKP